MIKKSKYEEVASLHVSDLFAGSKFAPVRPRRPIGKVKRKVVRVCEHEPMPARIEPPKHYKDIACPCCKQRVSVPDLDIIIDHYHIPPLQAAILRAVWRGRGYPVPTERIFDVMYADDPDGGPSPGSMYRAFKVAVHHLRRRLEGSGVSVVNAGYRRGYRLVMSEK